MGRKTISEQFDSVSGWRKFLLFAYYAAGLFVLILFARWLRPIVDPYSAIIAKWIVSLFSV
jgi:hypothetical protein